MCGGSRRLSGLRWAYNTDDGSTYDPAGFIVNGSFTQVTTDASSTTQNGSETVLGLSVGDTFGFRVNTMDDGFGRARITVSNFVVTCVNEPPVCTDATPSLEAIWPPNHKFVDITVEGVTDPDGDEVTINIDSIWQDEPTDTFGDGKFTPDATGVGSDTAAVRAERVGTKKVPGDGRVYHIAFTAEDGNGGECSGTVTVGVPHDVKDVAVDGGALFDSTL